MYSRQVEELARQRNAELTAQTWRHRPSGQPEHSGQTKHSGQTNLRSTAGWAIVAIGLRIAESGSKQSPVVTTGHPRSI